MVNDVINRKSTSGLHTIQIFIRNSDNKGRLQFCTLFLERYLRKTSVIYEEDEVAIADSYLRILFVIYEVEFPYPEFQLL